ncbi:ribosomal protein L7/L12 [Aquihabitans sp. G128]|uniref:ribosomal protein L7/L12 n=1 Tax=Aquihabitans sp. G128 TaxID=2849779 RepID=UPI001C21CE77|nr:ribosomal protein L7/L12 [Aquihabitans sp. G128]QXC60956.1 ribosomal protein L7/L12 [Aquihabitans sp. G128]
MTDPSTAELVARIEALEAQVTYLAHHLGLTPTNPGPGAAAAVADPMADVVSLVRTGKKIEAIKRYREIYGVGLKEAKTAVDRIG